MAEIFVCPKGSISDRSVRALREAGVVVVQADDPSQCKFLRPGTEMSDLDMLFAALKALQKSTFSGGTEQREEFTRVMFSIVNAKREKEQEA